MSRASAPSLRQRKAEAAAGDKAKENDAQSAATASGAGEVEGSPAAAPGVQTPAPAPRRCGRLALTAVMWAAKGAGLLLLLAIVFPFVTNQAGLQKESAFFMPSAEHFYSVGYGSKYYMACSGDGEATVVLEAAAGDTAEGWHYVVERMTSAGSPFRVCVYDRLGLGHTGAMTANDPARNPYKHMGASLPERKGVPFSAERATEDLRELINAANISRPFIFVANELGALHARFYTQLYEGDVAGIVLVNPFPETLFKDKSFKDAAAHWYRHLAMDAEFRHVAAFFGWSRLAVQLGAYEPAFPNSGRMAVAEPTGEDRAYAYHKHLLCSPLHLRAAANEVFAANESAAQLQVMSRFRAWDPLVPISALLSDKGMGPGASDAANRAWLAAQKDVLSRLPEVHQEVLRGKEHGLHIAYANAIFREAKRVLQRAEEAQKERRAKAEEEKAWRAAAGLDAEEPALRAGGSIPKTDKDVADEEEEEEDEFAGEYDDTDLQQALDDFMGEDLSDEELEAGIEGDQECDQESNGAETFCAHS